MSGQISIFDSSIKITPLFIIIPVLIIRKDVKMDFIPYKSNETLENKFYQIPQELFVNSLYKDNLNSGSKIIYSLLLDRLSLSQKNHWVDDLGRVYLIYPREDIGKKLNLSKSTISNTISKLKSLDYIKTKTVDYQRRIFISDK